MVNCKWTRHPAYGAASTCVRVKRPPAAPNRLHWIAKQIGDQYRRRLISTHDSAFPVPVERPLWPVSVTYNRASGFH